MVTIDVLADTDTITGHLERMRKDGFFRVPRSVSDVFCRLKETATLVDSATLGFTLGGMWRRDEVLRTVLRDGLLHYVDKTEAGKWHSIDFPASRAQKIRGVNALSVH